MVRRRSTPWIYRWSRPIMGAIALSGAILTAYLTVQKWTGQTVGCVAGAGAGEGGCNNVLNSSYATVFGLPLSLLGFLAYSAIVLFSLGPLLINPSKNKNLRKSLEERTSLLLLIQTTAMTAFSGYLMYVLAFDLQTFCPYCIGSAFFSLSLLALTLLGKDWEDIGQVFFTGLVVGMVTLVGTLGVYSDDGSLADSGESQVIPPAETAPEPPKGWEISTKSGESEIALAENLKEIGAIKYGAFWCPHCYEQKQLFGKTAFDKIKYIECDPRGVDPQPQACQEAGIRSYPSWEINGEIYRGTQPLERLAEISNYSGPTNFKYKLP